jgi:hypothetical protein
MRNKYARMSCNVRGSEPYLFSRTLASTAKWPTKSKLSLASSICVRDKLDPPPGTHLVPGFIGEAVEPDGIEQGAHAKRNVLEGELRARLAMFIEMSDE